MPGRTALVLCLSSALALALASQASADPYPTPIRVNAGPLSHTLQEIARQTGGELLFDRNLVAGLKAQKISINATPMAAVQIALAGTNLIVRRSASGALMIEAGAPPPLARQDVAVPDILVVGRRSQNVDIRRQETDIQPYRVDTVEQITSAHVDDLGEYFASHVTSNAAILDGLQGLNGQSNSQIDLRAVGPDQTLVLIDGQRMPDLSYNPNIGSPLGVTQTDLNAMPLHAIDRVETLTGTAGGLYGFGALGGVVNVVLAHDRPGAEAYITTGLSSRGDAGRASFEGRIEYSPDQGATDVTIDAGYTRSEPLTAGERDYLEKDRLATYQADPSDFISLTYPHGNSIGVFDIFGDEPLTLKPEYGGASLGAPYTYLPISFEGTPSQAGAALLSRAGQIDFSLSNGAASTYLEPNPELGSLLLNVRHQFSAGVEVYFDGIMLWNHGTYIDHDLTGFVFLEPTSPYDPFNQYVDVSLPVQGSLEGTTRFDSSRFTVGVVAPIAFGWRATAEATIGGAQYHQSLNYTYEDAGAYSFGDINPFAGWTQLQQELLAYEVSGSFNFTAYTRYLEQSLRLAGPVFQTAAGPATLTVLAEHRSEDFPGFSTSLAGDASALAGVYSGPFAPRSTTTTSISAEFRSRLFGDKAPLALLRDLEVQLAVRDDIESDDLSLDSFDPGSPRTQVTYSGAAYTVGAKVSPLPWLMLRGSFATGQTPPPLTDLGEEESFAFTQDPKRGDEYAFFDTKEGGSPNLKNVLASTASVGVVFTPFGSRGLQFSLDYSHVQKTHDVEFLTDELVLANEDYWPQRVTRGPLTAADQALGYTAGPITGLDATAINGATTDIQTLDARFDWAFVLPLGGLHLYGSATYNFSDVQKGLFEPGIQYDGYTDGPLTWRANAGADWSLGSLTIGVNVQYFGSYGIFLAEYPDPLAEALQGSDHVPAQAYMDLHISERIHLNTTDLRIDFGVNDVFDSSPPRVNATDNFGGSYSPYGDPRGRRFELTLSSAF